jgi:hypothetical protein
MLKRKTLTTRENSKISILECFSILLKISLLITLVVVSGSTFYLLFKSSYFGLATLLYKMFCLDLLLLIIIFGIKTFKAQINKNAN